MLVGSKQKTNVKIFQKWKIYFWGNIPLKSGSKNFWSLAIKIPSTYVKEIKET